MRQSAQDIITLLTTPPPLTVPSLQAGDTTRNASLQLATILNSNPLIETTIKHLESTPKNATILPKTSPVDPPGDYSNPDSLSEALARLTRVFQSSQQKNIEPATTINSLTQPTSFKHRSAKAILATHLFNIQTHKLNHVYDAQGN